MVHTSSSDFVKFLSQRRVEVRSELVMSDSAASFTTRTEDFIRYVD